MIAKNFNKPATLTLCIEAARAANSVAAALEDGKVTLAESLGFVPQAIRLVSNRKVFAAALEEFKAPLTDDEGEYIKSQVRAAVEFGNEADKQKLEDFVESCIFSVVQGIDLWAQAAALRQPAS